MFLNYLKVTQRNLIRNKTYSLVNIVGLAIGFACFSLIFIYVENERSYDTFNPDADRVFRVVGILNEAGLGEYYNAITPAPFGPALAADVPQVEATTRLFSNGSAFIAKGEKGFYEDNMRFADPAVFDILSVKLLEGDKDVALKEPHSVVLNQTMAKKYFGAEDPLGKQLTITLGNDVEQYAVTGVAEDYPKNSHVDFSMLASFVTLKNKWDFLEKWNTNCLTTYVLLKPNAARADVEAQFPDFVKAHIPDDNGSTHRYLLQPLPDIHLYSGHILYQANRNMGSANMVELFAAIGVLVLLIAAINYMNLATARSVKRAKEVGLRKVLGSERKHLIYRFVGESAVTALLGFVLSLIMVELVYPAFRSIVGDRLVFDNHHSPEFLMMLFGVCLVVGAASGLYPALVLSSYQPAQTLRGTFTRGKRGAALRKGLVFVQFSIAIILLVCTGVVRNQMEFVRTKEVGFDKSQLMYIPLHNKQAREQYPVMKVELLRNPAVKEVTAGGGYAGAGGSDGTMIVAGTNKQQRTMMRFSPVDYEFLKTMHLELVQGRDFSRDVASDSATGVIVNEAALRELGWTNAVGKQFEQDSGPLLNVIGVIRDYHFYSLYVKIEPQLLYISPNQLNYMLVKLQPGQIDQGVAAAQTFWKQQLPDQPFDYGFVDEAFDKSYRSDQNNQRLFTAFSIVAIFVGCLGLFGLSVFTAEQRTKEIGIRKVLGASVSSLVLKLSTESVKLVALSSLVAFPLAYWAMQEWLQKFAYRSTIDPFTFVYAAVIVVLIALATVSIQAIKVSASNPIETLRYE